MARLTALLRYARRSDTNRAKATSTQAGAVLEAFVTFALAIVIVNLLHRSGFGPVRARTSSAHQLWAVLTALLLFLPLGSRSSLQPSILSVQPIDRWTIRCFHVLSMWAGNRCVAALALAVLSTLFALRLPHTLHGFLLASLCFSSAILLSTGLALVLHHLQQGQSSGSRKSRQPTSRRWPIFRKDVRISRRLLDPWVTLLLALLVGISEVLGRWIGTAGASLSVLTCAVLCLPLFLLPFGLDTAAEHTRQQLMPLCTSGLLLRKHGAAATLFLVSCLPLSLAMLLCTSPRFALVYIEGLGTATVGLLIAGVLLFRSPALLRVRLSMGVFAGNQLPIAQFLVGTLLTAVPMVLVFLLQQLRTPFHHLFVVLLLAFMAVLYRVALRRVDQRQRDGRGAEASHQLQ